MVDLFADFHIHSKYSHDSLMEPEKIVKRAKKVGLNVIALTDHNTMRGVIETSKFGEQYGVYVMHGEEISTNCGDIIGLNLKEEIQPADWQQVIDAIHYQDGLVVLPHPYHNHIDIEKVVKKVDFIEIWNSRCTPEENMKAKHLAIVTKKKVMVNSDAHCLTQIGSAKSLIYPTTLNLKESLSQEYTPKWKKYQCHAYTRIKKGKIRELFRECTGLLSKKVGIS